MPNLNYDVPQDVPQDKLDVQIMDLIRKDRKISTENWVKYDGIGAGTFEEIGTQKYPIYTQGTI